VTVDAQAMVIGGGEDVLGSGQHDVFLRAGDGQLVLFQTNAAGKLSVDEALTKVGGGAFTIDGTTRVIGIGRDSGNGLKQLELQDGTATPVFWDLSGTTLSNPSSGSGAAVAGFGDAENHAIDSSVTKLVQAMATFEAQPSPGATIAAPAPHETPIGSPIAQALHH
jgi:hypothetical protein